MQELNIHVLELLASKICHDIISPVGAISNGVEIMEEIGTDGTDDVAQLIASSARRASAKLQGFRMAYGSGGADNSIRLEDVHKTFHSIIEGEARLSLEWDPSIPLGTALGGSPRPAGFCKLLMAALLMMSEALPKGGTIQVHNTPDAVGFTLEAHGDDAAFKPLTLEALRGELLPDELDPKLVHPYVLALLCQRYKFALVAENIVSPATGRLVITKL